MLKELYNTAAVEVPGTEEDPNAEYYFADGEIAPSEQLDAFIEEFKTDKEEKGAADEPTPEELALETDDPEDEDIISTQTARNTAQFIVSTIDEGASIGLAYLSKDDQDNFRAGKEQRKNLENLFTKYCKEKGTDIPLPWQIFFCLFTVYAAKVPYALDRRKINGELEAIQKEREALMADRKRLEEEQAANERERQMLRRMRKNSEPEDPDNNMDDMAYTRQ